MKLFFILFLSACMSTSAGDRDEFTLPDSIKAVWLKNAEFKHNRAIKTVSVHITEVVKLNDDVATLSRLSGAPQKNFTTRIMFTLPGSKTVYGLPQNDKTLDHDFYYANVHQPVADGKPVRVNMTVAMYRDKHDPAFGKTVFIIENIAKITR